MWLLIPILIYTVIYLYIRHIYSYWERKGFPSEPSGITWQFLKQAYKREFQHVSAICEVYQLRKEPLYGIYHFFRPTLMVRDVLLAKQLLENSNGHFADTKWDYVKGFRRFNLLERLAPIFSAGRVDGMFRNIEKVADYMVAYLKNTIQENAGRDEVDIDMQHISRIYAINVIGTMIYGLDFNNFTDGNNVFANYLQIYLGKYAMSSYTLSRLPKRSSLTYRLRDLFRENIEQREVGGKIRKDILQLLAKFRSENDLAKKDKWHVDNLIVREKMVSINVLSKIAEEFLNMSLDTIASVIVFTLYEVLREPAVLQKIFEEIRTIPEKDSINLSFATIDGLKYLDLCVQETLRKHPVVPIIERVCRKSYNIPESKFSIGKGKVIMIPLLAIQHDEKYFAEPSKYKPARFLVNGQHNKSACLSYGLGVGTCVAKTFGNTVIKVALVKIFQNFQMCLTDAEQVEVCYNPAPFIKSHSGLNVKLKNQEIKTKFYL